MIIDTTSFQSIYELHYKALYKFLGIYSRDSSIIEDVIHDVFVKLWEERNSVEISYVKTYLFHSARNRMLNLLRNEHQRLNLLENWFEDQEIHANDIDCYDIDAFYAKAQQAIDSLPAKCKELFLLNREQKMTYKQIADFKAISTKTVENQIGIALKKIRTYLITHPFILLLMLLLFIP
ncbi:RNA polymerase sigma-70 factor [bacterium]|jgi:RNA polymerase sigma-70 factor (ECF subfamily)|nr:RNA polymerase sigma-70 factor [bacterium]